MISQYQSLERSGYPKERQPKTKPAAKPAVAELPEWMDGTPSMIYTLEAFHEVERQRITMTLAEFEACKIYLCKLRGYQVPKEAAHV